jgi:hypothetical protein
MATFALDKVYRKIVPVKKAALFTITSRCSGAHNYRLGSNKRRLQRSQTTAPVFLFFSRLFVWIGKSYCFARLRFFIGYMPSPAKVFIFILILSFSVAVKITIQIIVSL